MKYGNWQVLGLDGFPELCDTEMDLNSQSGAKESPFM